MIEFATIYTALSIGRFGLGCAAFLRQSSIQKLFTSLRKDVNYMSYELNYISDQVTTSNRHLNAIKENPLKVGLEMMEYASHTNSKELESMYHRKAVNYLLEASNFSDECSDYKIVVLQSLSLCLYYMGDYKNSLRNLDKILGYCFEGERRSDIHTLVTDMEYIENKKHVSKTEINSLCPMLTKYKKDPIGFTIFSSLPKIDFGTLVPFV